MRYGVCQQAICNMEYPERVIKHYVVQEMACFSSEDKNGRLILSWEDNQLRGGGTGIIWETYSYREQQEQSRWELWAGKALGTPYETSQLTVMADQSEPMHVLSIIQLHSNALTLQQNILPVPGDPELILSFSFPFPEHTGILKQSPSTFHLCFWKIMISKF